MTHKQKRILANLVLSHGFDNLCEFWGELVDGEPNAPTWEQAEPVLRSWHKHMIALADKS